MPHILLQVRAFLRLMTSDETARRRADDAVMAGIVAGDTADDRAFQTTPWLRPASPARTAARPAIPTVFSSRFSIDRVTL
jgi:hypothetical protein